MNASRLLEIVSLLVEREADLDTQGLLSTANSALSQLVSSPSDAGLQKGFSDALDYFRDSLRDLRNSFQPAQEKLLEEIGASQFFLEDLAGEISEWISSSPATPATAQEKLAKLIKARAAYLSDIHRLGESLVAVGVETNGLEPGEAEIGFQLPRELFDNQLEKLIDELRFIRRAIRAFSEVATGSVQPIEVRQISTSDPLFFFGLDPTTIALLAGAVTWALSTWKQVEEIRKIRAETAKIQALKDEPINQLFDETIKKTIDAAIAEKTQELVANLDRRSGRHHEQETDLQWALRSILARVERGMTVEIRMLPPTQPAAEGVTDEVRAERENYEKLEQISGQLTFPKVMGSPVLGLPPVDKDKPGKKP